MQHEMVVRVSNENAKSAEVIKCTKQRTVVLQMQSQRKEKGIVRKKTV
jgi:hypothetical protein